MSYSSKRSTLRLAVIAAGVALGAGVAAAAQAAVKVAAGAHHGVWLKADGSVWAWGSNSRGQLGTGGEDALAPVPVPGLGAVRDIAAGALFTLAVGGDGTVWAWGDNEYGQLGSGGIAASDKPVRIAGLSGIVAVAAGSEYAMALSGDGAVWAWGKDATGNHSQEPKRVADLSGVVAIAAREKLSVALKRDGTVRVWGDHGAGDQGNGHYGLSPFPVQIHGLADEVAVAAGQQLTLAIKKDGTVWAVGYGASGQLGNGGTDSSTTPAMVGGLAGVRAVAAGATHVLAVKSDGTVWSWGYNHDGQLGNPRVTEDHSAKPVRSGTLAGVVAIAAGSNHSLAVTGDGVVWAWGQNEGGVLGADEEDLARADAPMRVGAAVPAECRALFACQTDNGKYIRICGEQDSGNVDKWTALQYRFGPGQGVPELVYPREPDAGPQPLYFSHEDAGGDYRVTVRFTNGGYSYRVFSGSKSGAGVDVSDAKGKRVAKIECAEAPEIYPEYLRLSLPCDTQNPHGTAACGRAPYRGK